MQWNQSDDDKHWGETHCRMLRDVSFPLSNKDTPLSEAAGLDTFREHFAMQARTQLRITEDITDADLRVTSDDGFALSITEVGAFGGDEDLFLSAPVEVAALAYPQPVYCKSFDTSGVTLEAGKIYNVDLRFWQRRGYKCLQARCCSGCSAAHDRACLAAISLQTCRSSQARTLQITLHSTTAKSPLSEHDRRPRDRAGAHETEGRHAVVIPHRRPPCRLAQDVHTRRDPTCRVPN